MDWKIELPEPDIDENMVQCSFCNSSQIPKDAAFASSQNETSKNKVFICFDCVRLGASQVDDVTAAEPEELEDPRSCNFCQRQQEFAEQIFAAGDKTLYVCTSCLSDFAAQIPAS